MNVGGFLPAVKVLWNFAPRNFCKKRQAIVYRYTLTCPFILSVFDPRGGCEDQQLLFVILTGEPISPADRRQYRRLWRL